MNQRPERTAPLTDESMIVWDGDKKAPEIIAILNGFFSTAGSWVHHSWEEFRRLVGDSVAQGALDRYNRTRPCA